MVEHLATLVDYFPGAANQTRCFSHILNLVAKSILCQFDVPKKTGNDDDDADGGSENLDDAANLLARLAHELEHNEPSVDNDSETDNEDALDLTDDDAQDNDGRDGLSEEEVLELEASLTPVRLTLTKVSELQTVDLKLIALSFELS